ncbi:MAG: tetratricopeptide repeat protein [Acidobacteria bacterium]|nr:tetratricopeptide repeat protein [Acidobacteriota bacterium]
MTSQARRFIVATGAGSMRSTDRPFSGWHVVVLGRLRLLSRRDVRAIVERLGGTFASAVTPRTSVVVRAGDEVDVPAHVPRVLTEDEFCLEAGLPDVETLRGQYHSVRELRSRHPSLTDDHLRYLERWGLIRPVAGRYAFSDLTVIRQAAAEIARGTPLQAWLRAIAAEREGQLVLDFQPDADRTPARVVKLPTPAPPPMSRLPQGRLEQIAAANQALAAKYFLEGAELDDGDHRDLDAAAAAYRRAAIFQPQLVPAIVNLANIHYERDQIVEAEALYEKAVRLDPECFEAHFNLANIHHDLGRYAEAIAAYREALAINPHYPEAHFYLAVTLEKTGRSAEAKPHWREYRVLAPEGEFVELAREFSE